MIKIDERHIAAVVAAGLIKQAHKMSSGELHDATWEALREDELIVASFGANQGQGRYPIIIQGVEGAYIVRAQEHDDAGVFDTLKEARAYVKTYFGEFLVR